MWRFLSVVLLVGGCASATEPEPCPTTATAPIVSTTDTTVVVGEIAAGLCLRTVYWYRVESR